MSHSHSRQVARSHRCGMMLLEMVIGIAALAVIMSGTLVLIAGLKAKGDTNNEFFLATQHLANLAEEIDAAKSGTEQEITLDSTAEQDLPGVELDIAMETIPVRENGIDWDTRQITCTLTWLSSNATTTHNTSLTLWKPLNADGSARREDTE